MFIRHRQTRVSIVNSDGAEKRLIGASATYLVEQ